jgi:hypothetical protein
LLLKLETYAITGKGKESFILTLKADIKEFLIYNAHHYSTLSNMALIKHVAPQGFILGPCYFFYA